MINGMDVSIFQEYLYGVVKPENLRPIDWAQVFADPRRFEFVYVKAAHGYAVPGIHPDAYPVESWFRNLNAIRAQGKPAGPYHYWYWKLNGVKVDPAEQAKAFYTAVKNDIGDLPPCGDIEDTSAVIDCVPLSWTTAEANAKLINARQVLASLAVYLEEMSNLFKRQAVPYSGPWWINQVAMQVRYYYPQDLDWMKQYGWFSADYTGPLDDVPEWKEIIHQHASTAIPAIPGITVTGGTRVDLIRWLGTDEEFRLWRGLPPVVPPVKHSWAIEITNWAREQDPPYAGPGPE